MRRSRSREVNVFSVSAIDLFASGMGVFIILYFVLMPLINKRSQLKQMKSQSEVNLLAKMTKLEFENKMLKEKLEQGVGVSDDQKKWQAAVEAQQQMQMRIDSLKQRLEEVQNKLSKNIANRGQQSYQTVSSSGSANAKRRKTTQHQGKEINDTLYLQVYGSWNDANANVDIVIVDPAGNEFSPQSRKIGGYAGEHLGDNQPKQSNERFQSFDPPEGVYTVYVQKRNQTMRAVRTKVTLTTMHRHKQAGPYYSPPITLTPFSNRRIQALKFQVQDKKAFLLED